MNKYQPLGEYLAALGASQASVTLTFQEIEKIIGAKLPRSAVAHRAWWANQESGSRAPHWQRAGFKVNKVNQEQGVLTFRRKATEPEAYNADERALEHELRGINSRAAKEEGLGSDRLTTLLRVRGGLGAAKYLLRPKAGGPGDIFNGAMAAGRPDLTIEYIVLQERFRKLFEHEELTEARRRLGWLDTPTITDITDAIEDQAPGCEFGELQAIRQNLKGLKQRSHTIFRPNTIFDRYAFHYGGRTELQFNVGFEDTGDGEEYLRHGLAISLKRGPSVHDIGDAILTRVARLNEFIETRADEFTDFLMYNSWYNSNNRSGDHPLRPVPSEVVELDAFIFIGKRQSATQVSTALILKDFDRLLPMYKFVEGKDAPPDKRRATPPEFVPGLTRKPTSAKISVTERKLNKNLRHNDIQYALGCYLVEQHGTDAVRDEFPTGNGTKIDLAVKQGDEFTYYEIKIGETARSCIRQGIGQLLEYSYWPEARRAVRLVVIGEPELDADARKYLMDLRREFELPLYYQQFNMKSRRVQNA